MTFVHDVGEDIGDWRVPTRGLHVEDAGLIPVAEITDRSATGTLLRGVFKDAQRPGAFVSTRIPARCQHLHAVSRETTTALRFTSTTRLTHGLGQARAVRGETTWVCATCPLSAAIAAYARHLPPRADPPPPPVGWNSWDYYYSAVSAADISENLDAITADPRLTASVQSIVIDMGWEHAWGDWYANYRFPRGLAAVAREITERGFMPGIWTAPVMVDPLSYTGLRGEGLWVLDDYGDPLRVNGKFLIDPTSPAGRDFLTELFSRLESDGFRLFKVDFVDGLTEATRFFDHEKGPHDALRDLFAIIRAAVGAESHILGCSLPPETGPWVADSGRTGVDIHNQWSHVEWAFDYLQLTYWLHGRVWINDPDFLVVRGATTSRDVVMTVRNPAEHQPNPPKWRRGPVFSGVDEARTWAAIVGLSGGSVFLSDRLTMLNGAGVEIVHQVLGWPRIAARPLDLGDGPRAALWLQEGDADYRLAVLNWSDAPTRLRFAFRDHHLTPPDSVDAVWSERRLPVDAGACVVDLPPHGSEMLTWTMPAVGSA